MPRFISFGVLVGALCLCLMVGCGRKTPEGMPKLVPCSISITQDNKPLEDATVMLVSEGLTWTVGGTTDHSGVAKIYTHGTYPGAPVGNYKVVVSKQIVESVDNIEVSASVVVSGGVAHEYVAEEFRSADTTPLTLEIKGKTSESFDVGAAVDETVKPL